jgi:hypothetical protein
MAVTSPLRAARSGRIEASLDGFRVVVNDRSCYDQDKPFDRRENVKVSVLLIVVVVTCAMLREFGLWKMLMLGPTPMGRSF